MRAVDGSRVRAVASIRGGAIALGPLGRSEPPEFTQDALHRALLEPTRALDFEELIERL